MAMKLRDPMFDLYTKLEELVEEINMEADLIIVEGKRDEEALRVLKSTVGIIKLSGDKGTHQELIEKMVRYKRVVILTDFDRHGEKFNKELLISLGGKVKILRRYRFAMKRLLCKYGRRDLESISNLKKSFDGDLYG